MANFGFQERWQGAIDRGVGMSDIYRSFDTGDLDQYHSGRNRLRQNLNIDPNLNAYTRKSAMTVAGNQPQARFARSGILGSMERTAFRGLAASETGVLNFANKINDHLLKQGGAHGLKGGFQSVGQVMAKMPLKKLGTSYAIGTPMMLGMEVMLMGKPLSMATVADTAWHNIPFTIGMELAGGGLKGIGKHMGYQLIGETMGLGPWGSLAFQIAGSTYLPGLGPTAAVVMGAYHAGKGAYSLHKEMYKLGKAERRSEFETGDMSFATAEAATMRQRAVGAIQKSHLNMRSMLGREATILMGR